MHRLLICGLLLGLAGCTTGTNPTRPTEPALSGPLRRFEGSFRCGLDVLQAEGFSRLEGRGVGLVTNQTGVNHQLESNIDLLARHPRVRLVAIFGPEHGIGGAAQAGERVQHGVDSRTHIPIYSLYGEKRRPTPDMLEGIDVLLFDIQDIGVRTYTYLATLEEVLRACAESATDVWVLDRPVPIGGAVIEGPVLQAGMESFVGPHRTPLRHGLTAGEFALLINQEENIGATLKVVSMEGYRRELWWEAFDQAWVAPSPNIPTVDTALLYAGMVLVEGTNLSEGRGTAAPFHQVGAPWVDAERLASGLRALSLPGCRFRVTRFNPTFSKYQGRACHAVQVHLTDRNSYHSVATAVSLLSVVRRLFGEHFEFRSGFFDRLAGTPRLREALEAGVPPQEIVDSWNQELAAFASRREPFLLYE